MKNKDIYKSALSLISEDPSKEVNEDLAERAPYLIAAFCNEVKELDDRIRRVLGIPEADDFDGVYIPLDREFPLLDRFAAVAARYLAAMLMIDEDSELSDKLYSMYCDGISLIQKEIPSAIERIVDKYL